MNLKQIIPFLVLILVLVSCDRLKEPKKPKNLLSKEQMVNIIIDAKLIASASAIKKNIMRDSGVVINNYIYKRHNIDSMQFEESNRYYAFYVKDYEDIYNKVSDSLEKLKELLKEQQAEERKKETKREEDSLKAVKKDTTGVSVATDSLALKTDKATDSLTKILKQKNAKTEALIEPISDTDAPRQ